MFATCYGQMSREFQCSELDKPLFHGAQYRLYCRMDVDLNISLGIKNSGAPIWEIEGAEMVQNTPFPFCKGYY